MILVMTGLIARAYWSMRSRDLPDLRQLKADLRQQTSNIMACHVND